MSPSSRTLHRILVATDFSDCGQAAVEQAALVAEAIGAELTILHAITDIREAMASLSAAARWELVAGDFQQFEEALNHKSNASLLRTAERLRSRIKVDVLTVTGAPFVRIIQEVERRAYALVFVGTRGHSRLHRLLVGSTAQRLVRHCPAPVWVVKSTHPRLPRRVLSAVDLSATSGRALALAASIAGQTDADLHVLHVLHEPMIATIGTEPILMPTPSKREINREVAQQLGEFVAAHISATKQPRLKVAWGTPWHKIESFAQQVKADLVVMGTVGRSGLANLVLGNTAERLLPTASRDILIVKPAGFVSRIPTALKISSHESASKNAADPREHAGTRAESRTAVLL